jgi:molybdate transport system ATP-binding protein
MTAVSIDVTKVFPNFSLNLRFSAKEGITVLFGPSGAGKTLTLHCIAGFVRPDRGNIHIGGVTYFDHVQGVDCPIHKRRFGYVPQDVHLFPHMTVYENIAYGISHQPGEDVARSVGEMMELLNLDGIGSLLPREASGGQRQRVGLARALVTEPVALLLDEPFAALDTPVRTKLRGDLLRIRERFNIPTLLVTHDVEEAYFLADRVAVLNEGQLEQVGTREEVFYRPRTRQVAEFFNVKNIFNGEVVDADASRDTLAVRTPRFTVYLPYEPDYPVGAKMEFCVRPEEVMIIREGQPVKDILKENIFTGRVVRMVDKGALRDLFVQIGHEEEFDFQVTLPSHVVRDLELHEGGTVGVGLKKPSLWIIPGREKEGPTA